MRAPAITFIATLLAGSMATLGDDAGPSSRDEAAARVTGAVAGWAIAEVPCDWPLPQRPEYRGIRRAARLDLATLQARYAGAVVVTSFAYTDLATATPASDLSEAIKTAGAVPVPLRRRLVLPASRTTDADNADARSNGTRSAETRSSDARSADARAAADATARRWMSDLLETQPGDVVGIALVYGVDRSAHSLLDGVVTEPQLHFILTRGHRDADGAIVLDRIVAGSLDDALD